MSSLMKHWAKLEYPVSHRTRPLMINGIEFIILTDDSIRKYNTKTMEWTKIIKFGKEIVDDIYLNTLSTSWFKHKDKNIVYIVDDDYKFVIDLDTNSIEREATDLQSRYRNVFLMNDEIHCMIDEEVDDEFEDSFVKHVSFDIDMKKHHVVSEMKQMPTIIEGEGWIALKQRGKILLFGGYGHEISDASRKMHEFSFQDNQWTELGVKLPIDLSDFGVVMTRNEQYLVIIGGWFKRITVSKNIYVFDLDKYEWSVSQIKCIGGYCSAVITNDEYKDIVLTYGYIRDSYRGFENMPYLSDDIMRLMSKWISNQEIHLIQGIHPEYHHWKINIDEILQ